MVLKEVLSVIEYAHLIVERFGTDTIEVIEDDIERLYEVAGIGKKILILAGKAQPKIIREDKLNELIIIK